MVGGFFRIHSEADYDRVLEIIEAECTRWDHYGVGDVHAHVCPCAKILDDTGGVYMCPNVLARITAAVA